MAPYGGGSGGSYYVCYDCKTSNWADNTKCRYCVIKKSYADALKSKPAGKPGKQSKHQHGQQQSVQPAAESQHVGGQHGARMPAVSSDASAVANAVVHSAGPEQLRVRIGELSKVVCMLSQSESAAAVQLELEQTKQQLYETQPVPARIEKLRAVIDRSRKRLGVAQSKAEEAQRDIQAEQAEIGRLTQQLRQCEMQLASSGGSRGQGRQ